MANNPPPMPPGWPIRYPCIANNDYTSQPASEVGVQTLSIDRHDLGEILGAHTTATGAQWARVSIFHKGIDGWVPRNVLTIGTVRRCGDYRVTGDLPTITSVNIPPFQAGTNDQLFRAIHAITETWAAGWNPMGLANVTPDSFYKKIDTAAKRLKLSKEIYQAYGAAGMVLTLNRPKFTLQDIVDAAVKVTSPHTSGEGIYIMLYRGFPNRSANQFELMPGETNHFGRRRNDHFKQLSKGDDAQLIHHRRGSKAAYRECIIFALCDLVELRKIIEQYTVLLLESQRRTVLTLETQGTSHPAQLTAKYYGDREAAILFSRVADSAKARSRWPGGCRRLNSDGTTDTSFLSEEGYSWNSPIREGQATVEKVLWIRTEIRGISAEYTRSPTIVQPAASSSDSTLLAFQISHSTYLSNATTTLVRDRERFKAIIGSRAHDHLPPNTKVYPSIQITLDGRPHPDPYAPLTTVPHFGDWTSAQQLGVCLSFENPPGTQKTTFLHSESPRMRDEGVPSSLSSYAQAIAIKNYLEQRVCDDNHKFIPNFGIARVKDLIVDHLNQTISVRARVPPANNTIPRTTIITPAQKHTYMAQAGCLNIDGTFAAFPGAPYSQTHPGKAPVRRACDRCHILRVRTGSHGTTCVDSGNGTCTGCIRFGYPCSWTPTHIVNSTAGDRICDALVHNWRRQPNAVRPSNHSYVRYTIANQELGE